MPSNFVYSKNILVTISTSVSDGIRSVIMLYNRIVYTCVLLLVYVLIVLNAPVYSLTTFHSYKLAVLCGQE